MAFAFGCTIWADLPTLIHKGGCSQTAKPARDKAGNKIKPAKCHWPYDDRTVKEK